MKNFAALSEQEILALAISLEEEDERVYADYSEGLRVDFPATAAIFDGMRLEEVSHRRRLIELYRQKLGEHVPLIRRQDVKGFVPFSGTERPCFLLLLSDVADRLQSWHDNFQRASLQWKLTSPQSSP